MKLLSRALALAILCFAPIAANASSTPSQLPPLQCDITAPMPMGDPQANPACSTYPASPYLAVTTSTYNPWLGITTTAYQAVRSDWGNPLVPVDVWGMCRYIDNQSNGTGLSIFVPFKAQKEWQNFVTVAGSTSLSYISLNTCAVPWQPTPIPPADTQAGDPQYCGSPLLSSPPPPFPYAMTGSAAQSTSAQYSCTCADGTTKWTQAATVTYSPGDSDNNASNGGWSQTTPANCTGSVINNVCYTGAVPDGCSGGDGQCGPADGTPAQTAPSGDSNLCTVGTPSAVTQDQNSNWIWTCTGSGSGPNNVASCKAPYGDCPPTQVNDTFWYCPPADGANYVNPMAAPYDDAACWMVSISTYRNVDDGQTYSANIKTNLPAGYEGQTKFTGTPFGAMNYSGYFGGQPAWLGWNNSAPMYQCQSGQWQKVPPSGGGGGGCLPKNCCGAGCHQQSK